jgi:phage-related minor tail protein
MSREGLAETLLLEDKLKGLTADKAAAATKDFETLKARVGEQEAMRILEEKGAEGLEKQVGMGDKLNATMDKLKEIFVVVGEALMPVFDVLISVFKIIGPIMKGLSPVFRLITLIGNAIGDVLAMLSGDFSFSGTKSAFGNMKPTDFLPPGFAAVGEFAGVPTMDELMGEEKAMATGGIVKGPTRALIGEAGPEAVIPLSGNTPALKVDNSETNNLLKIIAGKLTTVDMYEVQ